MSSSCRKNLSSLAIVLTMLLLTATANAQSDSRVILIDATGSMIQVTSSGANRLGVAKQAAKDTVDGWFEDTSPTVCVGYFSREYGVVFGTWQTDPGEIKNDIDAVPPPDGRTNLAAAMCAAAEKIQHTGGFLKFIYTFTDGEENDTEPGDFGPMSPCASCASHFETYDWPIYCDPDISGSCSGAQDCVFNSIHYHCAWVVHYFGYVYNKNAKAGTSLETGKPVNPNPDFKFLEAVADSSGGFVVRVTDDLFGNPAPGLGTWGLMGLSLLLITVGVWIVRRRKCSVSP